MNRIAQAVAEAVLEDQGSKRPAQQAPREHKLITTPRALLIGAGLFTAGRLLVGSRARNVVGGLQDRLVEFEHRHLMDNGDEPSGEEDLDDEEFDEEEPDEEPENEEDYEDEPEDEYDEEEPAGEYDEDEEEPEEEPSRSASR